MALRLPGLRERTALRQKHPQPCQHDNRVQTLPSHHRQQQQAKQTPDDRQSFIATFQQTTSRQHAQQVDHDENAVGVDDQRVQINLQCVNTQRAHRAAAQYGIQGIQRKLAFRQAREAILRFVERLRPNQPGKALDINIEAGKTGEIADDTGDPQRLHAEQFHHDTRQRCRGGEMIRREINRRGVVR